MGTSTDGLLAYGYDLGSSEKWKVREAQETEANPYGYLKLDWYDTEVEELIDSDGEEIDFRTAMIRRLYERTDGVQLDNSVEYDWEKEERVKDLLGVKLVSYCSCEYPMWILATQEILVGRGSTRLINWKELDEQAFAEAWDSKLINALMILGLTPLQERAGWVLASYWAW